MLASLIALSLATLQESPTLLPETPEGWRYERIDFPLTFAPDLAFDGFEELSFAPGMFDPESDTYFTYVLDIRLEGQHAVDAAWLEDFLVSYYRGLCKAVGESRQLELDWSSVTASIRDEGRFHAASITMFDSFVTGDPLALSLEIDVHPGPDTTEVFGIASPMPRDGAAWKQLESIRDAWRESRPVPVLLNHLFVVPDEETYRALSESEFLRKNFAVSETRTTVRTDLTYTGTYFYGERTYFEFLQPGSTERFLPGATGLAFGIERPGGSKAVMDRLGQKGVQAFAGPRTRELDGEQVPWFLIFGIQKPNASSRLDLFSLEYEPDFLKKWKPELPPAVTGIRRDLVLTRYAASLERLATRDETLFEDVTEVMLRLDEEERARIFAVWEAYGYPVLEVDAERGSPSSWSCEGPGYRLLVEGSETTGGVTGFRVRLRRAFEREPLVLGKATIRFEGESATFTLAP